VIYRYAAAALVLVTVGAAGSWWATSRFVVRPLEKARDEMRNERDAANVALETRVSAGVEAQKEAGKALKAAQAANASDRALIARLRADLAAGANLSCADAAARVRLELAP
jgi:predicted phage gp36 major capsid-like protein